jgi:hypothetical protein
MANMDVTTLTARGLPMEPARLASYRDLWAICGFVAVGLAAAFALAVMSPMSTDLITAVGG